MTVQPADGRANRLGSLGAGSPQRPDDFQSMCDPDASRYVWLHMETGEVRPVACRNATQCLSCAKVRVAIFRRLLGITKPEALVTLTDVGDDWPIIRDRMQRLREYVGRSQGPVKWAWTVEKDSSAHHIHAWTHGDLPDPARLSQRAQQVGMGADVHLRRRRDERGDGYLFKDAISPDPAVRQEYLAINGGRLLHNSRGFWRDGETGLELPGSFREVAREVRRRTPRAISPWQLTHIHLARVAARST